MVDTKGTSPAFGLVSVIDIGTTHSGYAFALKDKPDEIHLNQDWGNQLGFSSLKTPTNVLVDKKGKFLAFGFEAERIYGKKCVEKLGENYELYRHFKMSLHNDKNLTRQKMLESTCGKQRPAITIFAMAIRYMKKHLLERVRKQFPEGELDHSRLFWWLTIPAVWTPKAKQFMREAAVEANLVDNFLSKNLQFALEPEVAAYYCRSNKVGEFVENISNEKTDIQYPPGIKYMVLDIGGGTLDISVHEVLKSGQVKEIIAANGGDHGGLKVDENFIKLLKKLFGEDFVETYRKEYPHKWLEMMINFETKKRGFQHSDDSGIYLEIPRSLEKKVERIFDKEIEEVCDQAEGVIYRDELILKRGTVLKLFHPVIGAILCHTKQSLQQPQMKDIKYIILVGGFGQCDILRNQLVKDLGKKYTVITPAGAGMAIIKGAVMFGQKPEQVRSRVARKSYGCKVDMLFIKDKHDPKYQYTGEDNKQWCRNLWKTFVLKDEVIDVGEKKSFILNPIKSNQITTKFMLYATDKTDITYVDEEGVEKVGEIEVSTPDTTHGWDRQIELLVSFGGTEIEVQARDLTEGGDVVNSTLDFLCE